MQIEIATLSKTGARIRNEDACGVWSSSNACFCVLADGAGGHGGGDVASQLVVRHVLEHFQQRPDCTSESVKEALITANQAVLDAQKSGDSQVSDMRTTIVVLAIDTERREAVWGHVGDTRLYCFRSNYIVAQTKDHSVVQQMVDAGYLKPEDMRSAPARNQLLAAIGEQPAHFQFTIQPQPFSIRLGDVFFLCTDGCWEGVEEHEMEDMLNASQSGEDWLHRIDARITAIAKKSQDNYSAISVWCGDPHKTQMYVNES